MQNESPNTPVVDGEFPQIDVRTHPWTAEPVAILNVTNHLCAGCVVR